MAFSKYNGTFEPTHLGILQRVFDRLCGEQRLALKDRDQRERLACEIIDTFKNGLTEETDLWRALSKQRSAKPA